MQNLRPTRAWRRRVDPLAEQVRGCFAQDDQSVANAAGATVRADINANLQALVTNSSGASAPSTTWAYQWWADTTTGLLKQRNAANSAWITVGLLSGLWASPGAIGSTTPAAGTFTTLVGTDTTDSTSSTTGAGKIAGGLGVAKALYVGTDHHAGGAAVGSIGGVTPFHSGVTSTDGKWVWGLQHSGSNPFGLGLLYSTASNDAGHHFIFCYDGSATRFDVYSNGGIANYSANDVNLSDERVKTDFVPMPSFRAEFAAMHGQWTRFKYDDQTHDDYNNGYRAQTIREVFGAKAPELVDWWQTEERVEVDGEMVVRSIPEEDRKLAVYNEDLKNIGLSVLSEVVVEQDAHAAQLAALRAEFDAYKAAHP